MMKYYKSALILIFREFPIKIISFVKFSGADMNKHKKQ